MWVPLDAADPEIRGVVPDSLKDIDEVFEPVTWTSTAQKFNDK